MSHFERGKISARREVLGAVLLCALLGLLGLFLGQVGRAGNDNPFRDLTENPSGSNIPVTPVAAVTSATQAIANLDGAGLTTATVTVFIASGRACAIYGHQWDVAPWTTDPNGTPVSRTRKCRVCGKTETQTVSSWR